MKLKTKYYITSIFLTAIVINLSYFLSYLLRFQELPVLSNDYILSTSFVMTVYLITFFDFYRYKRISMLDIVYNVLKFGFIATLFIATIAYFDWTFRLPRTIIILLFLCNFVLLSLLYIVIRPKIDEEKNVVIVGMNEKVPMLIRTLERRYSVLGFLDDKCKTHVENTPLLGTIAEIRRVIKKYRINRVIIALPHNSHEKILDILLKCHNLDVKIKTVPELYEYVLTNTNIGEGLMDISVRPIGLLNGVLKRCFDILFSVFGLIISIPFWIIVPVLIKIDSKGSVFYGQKRSALYNKTFCLYKFRTMVEDAEEKTGAVITDGKDDPRITKIGGFLRKYHVDEIPQLLSILKGDMSVVGPRPERPELNKQFNEQINGWSRRIFIKPGLTGLAQINNASGLDPKEKIKWDLNYIKNQSLWLDMKIVLRQIWKTFFRRE